MLLVRLRPRFFSAGFTNHAVSVVRLTCIGYYKNGKKCTNKPQPGRTTCNREGHSNWERKNPRSVACKWKHLRGGAVPAASIETTDNTPTVPSPDSTNPATSTGKEDDQSAGLSAGTASKITENSVPIEPVGDTEMRDTEEHLSQSELPKAYLSPNAFPNDRPQ